MFSLILSIKMMALFKKNFVSSFLQGRGQLRNTKPCQTPVVFSFVEIRFSAQSVYYS